MSGVVRAPEIDRPGLEWFNVPGPLSLAMLAGKLVILDFWTFCCINCMHILPTLSRIEETFAEEVVVIGVHSPKFAAERQSANLAHAIARLGIVHPVVHDPELRLWQEYAVRAWPSLVFISPAGRVIGHFSGEPDPDLLTQSVAEALAQAKAAGALAPSPLTLEPVAAGGEADASGLRFPAKMKPLPARAGRGSARWAVADAGHHQIVIFDGEGKELRRFGSGAAGFEDGGSSAAAFDGPQGLCAGDGVIYVADTFNHAIRRIELATGGVTTCAGTGRRGRPLEGEAAAKKTALASVWDLEIDGNRLYFANAGTHQLGKLDLDTGAVRRLAGRGAENIHDGPAHQALLAQPSGLALNGARDTLYFTDSETSAIRALDLAGTAEVRTLVGTGLYDFGARNGAFADALFQHPLGIAWHDGRLFVADSYNGALRVMDLEAGRVNDLDEGSFVCTDPLCLPAAEPAGVTVDGSERLFMVDTNNHRVVEYRLNDKTYGTWAG